MKSTPTLFFLLFVFFTNGYSQIAYVDINATGNNDGSSWSDAYTDLNDALENQSVNEIWVAKGTYTPGVDTSSTFWITRPLSIYGGFAGTEVNREDRNPATNAVALSGDVLANDIPGDLSTNRTDNSRHIIFVDEFLGGPFILDGVTVSGGTNNDLIDNAPTDMLYRGAGIYALSPCTINNCSFTANICYSGAAIFMRDANTYGSSISNCQLYDNRSIGQGVVFALNSGNLSFSNLTFQNNQSARGCIYTNRCQTATVDGCTFSSNAYPNGYGGVYFDWHSSNVTINDCSFTNNVAANGGCIYVDQRDLTMAEKPASIFKISNSNFSGNSATDYGGGGLYAFRASYTIDNCVFTQNSAGNSGGAIVNGGDDKVYEIKNSQFENNTAGFGGASNNYGENTFGSYTNCSFKNNTTGTSGGALIVGFKSMVNVKDCSFESNSARWGGAIYCQNDTTNLVVENSSFYSNTADNFGGAINVFGGIDITVSSSAFEANESNFGGAVAIGRDTNGLGSFMLEANIFNFNLANTQAGAVNLNNAKGDVINNLFVNNIASGDGIGGAISANAFSGTGVDVAMTNNTFTDNLGIMADAFTAFADTASLCKLDLLNNVFHNINSTNFYLEMGEPEINSLGGNFSNDASLTAYLTNTNDENDNQADPLFLDAANFDYHLTANSPFVNKGVNGGPEKDLDGKMRDASPDMGCYEFDGSSAIQTRFIKIEELNCSPNPVNDRVTITGELPDNTTANLLIYDLNGKQKIGLPISPIGYNFSIDLQTKDWVPGVYLIRINQGNAIGIERLIKI